MANLRDIRNRINSVQNTQQVTRAMKMVAAAKLRRAQERILLSRPYAYKLREIINHIRSTLPRKSFSELSPGREEVERVLLIVITGDRGLAGAFNNNIIKEAEREIREQYQEYFDSDRLDLICLGRKGHEHFAKRNHELIGDYRGLFSELDFEKIAGIADRVIEGYLDHRWDRILVVYNEFKNTISQNRIVEPYLPIPAEEFHTPVMEQSEVYHHEEGEDTGEIDYIYEPSAKEIFRRLLPEHLRFQLWRAVLESNAAEQGARMVAMENATNNAGDLLRELRLSYNQARQAAITNEILEISSGAEALANQ